MSYEKLNPRDYPIRPNGAVELLRGLDDRSLNHIKRNFKAKENREVYAEDELIRKKFYDEMRCEMPGQPRSTFLMVFSHDGSRVASTHGNHNIYVTDIKSGKNIRTLVGHPRTPWCIAFHPTSNQIVASGCLGGEVRIWDLSGGSEVWTADNQAVIASIAFHPNDRILVIATCNELYFWDWSRPEPFAQIATSNPKEKIRYVAFDQLGHKLITGIANSPHTRWERTRTAVPLARPTERSPSPYRIRITPGRLPEMRQEQNFSTGLRTEPQSSTTSTRDQFNGFTERESRIASSYRNLLREYEQLVQRYLTVYRPPTMIDRGTDPMESNAGTPEPVPGTSSQPDPPPPVTQTTSLVMPSRILAMQKSDADSSQAESRKHKSSEAVEGSSQEKRSRSDEPQPSTSSTSHSEVATQTHSPRRLLVINDRAEPSTSSSKLFQYFLPSKVEVLSSKALKLKLATDNVQSSASPEIEAQPGPSRQPDNQDNLLNIRPIAEEMRTRFLPIIKSLPACDRPRLLRSFIAYKRMKYKHMSSTVTKKLTRWPVFSDSSSSDDEHSRPGNSSTNNQNNDQPSTSTAGPSTSPSSSNVSGVRNFVMQLERLLMKVLIREMGETNGQNSINENATSTSTENQQSEETIRLSPVSISANRDQDLIRPSAVTGTSFLGGLSNTEDPGPSSSTARTTSPVYSRIHHPRRRIPVHRISAFIPTRGNRNSLRYRRGFRSSSNTTYSLDELINYSERPDAEANLPQDSNPPTPISPPPAPTDNANINTVYSNIVQDLETSLNDVRNIRSSNLSNETSDMLSSFSDSLENIMNQSDTILRNLRGLMSMLPEPQARDSNYYVRLNAQEVVEMEHSYPRNVGEGMAPLMTSLHLTISYIQQQARLLRQQVESIERIDRSMFEVKQLQLIRHLIMEFLRYIRSLGVESRSAGVSSVRQMMAGTRISDSSPYESQAEEAPQTSAPSTSTGSETSPRPRNSRKTYPPSRLVRMQRHWRTNFIHFFPRRYTGRAERAVKAPSRNIPPRRPQETARHYLNYSQINGSSLNLMARRLEHLLTEQTRIITRPQDSPRSQTASNISAMELGERILSLRLNDCLIRMSRIVGNNIESRFRTAPADSITVTQDGSTRFGARHFLSLILDGMSKHIEELGGSNLSQVIRSQIHSVLAMALLLSDLLLLQLVDSIPPPAGINIDVERESITSRIDRMCGQMLQNRFSGHSHHLTRSLHTMRLNMRHANRALGQTYTARRNAILPTGQDSRRQLLNRYLRNINRRRNTQSVENHTRNVTNLRDLIMRYSDNAEEEETSASNQERRFDLSDNSDNDDEAEWYVGNSARNGTALYRTNNVNLVNNNNNNNNEEQSTSSRRPWNVPSVQINDVPVPEPGSVFHNRVSYRQRLAERVSELTSFSQMNILRPRFLHPLYSGVNPFDADLDDPHRETVSYDCDIVTTVTPNHRIQAWDISAGNIPAINNPFKNIIVAECKIHNDASVDIAKDGSFLVTLLPSGNYLNVTNKLGVYSLKWENLGHCLYTTSFELNAVSVALSPLSRYLVVGLASRRVSIVPSDRWTMARVFILNEKNPSGDALPVLRQLEQSRDSRATNYKSVNCIRWLPTSGQGFIYATNTGQLVILT